VAADDLDEHHLAQAEADALASRALCQMAFMFFPDRARVLREMARVVVAGGTVALSVPSRPDSQPAYAPFVEMAARHAGPEATGLLSAYFVCGDLDALRSLVHAAGLVEVTARTYRGTVRCPSIDGFVATEVESTPLRERISDGIYGRIRADARALLQPFPARRDGRDPARRPRGGRAPTALIGPAAAAPARGGRATGLGHDDVEADVVAHLVSGRLTIVTVASRGSSRRVKPSRRARSSMPVFAVRT
jgi:hypothetical protein